MSDTEKPILTVDRLAVSFGTRGAGAGQRLQAVADSSMTLYPRQTLAVVGESGSGKSVTALSALQLIPRPPGRFDRGRILLSDGDKARDLLTLPEREIRKVRGGDVAMIFQEPMTSLNPVFTIGQQIVEAIRLHQDVSKAEAREAAVAAMNDVGIVKASERLDAYPHQFSGGMRQRVMIAMALACRPRVLLADEPTTALDVTIQAQILELLRRLQAQRGLAIMLITHALGVVAQNADVVAVMYAGRVVEYATVTDLFRKPLHPYTRGLLASIPHIHHRAARLTTIRELVQDPAQFDGVGSQRLRPWWPEHEPPVGTSDEPETGLRSVLTEIEPGHWVAVWRTSQVLLTPRTHPDLSFRVLREPAAAALP